MADDSAKKVACESSRELGGLVRGSDNGTVQSVAGGNCDAISLWLPLRCPKQRHDEARIYTEACMLVGIYWSG